MKKLIHVTAFIYLLILCWTIIFKGQLPFQVIEHHRNINLVPFAGSIFVKGKIDLIEIFANVFAFIPLGLLLSFYFPKTSLLKKGFIILVVSIVFECIQYIFAMGISDITDVIGNYLGGFIGVFLGKLFDQNEDTKEMWTLILLWSFIVIVLLIIFFIQTGMIQTRYFWN